MGRRGRHTQPRGSLHDGTGDPAPTDHTRSVHNRLRGTSPLAAEAAAVGRGIQGLRSQGDRGEGIHRSQPQHRRTRPGHSQGISQGKLRRRRHLSTRLLHDHHGHLCTNHRGNHRRDQLRTGAPGPSHHHRLSGRCRHHQPDDKCRLHGQAQRMDPQRRHGKRRQCRQLVSQLQARRDGLERPRYQPDNLRPQAWHLRDRDSGLHRPAQPYRLTDHRYVQLRRLRLCQRHGQLHGDQVQRHAGRGGGERQETRLQPEPLHPLLRQ